MRNERVQEMTLMALFIAIIAIMSFVPWLGFITIGAAAITIIHIPVLIGGVVIGRRMGIVLATAFGVFSMIRAFMTPEALNIFFQNPLVSVLPRIAFGVALWYIYRGVHALFVKWRGAQRSEKEKHARELTAMTVSFGLSTLVHTVLVLVALYLFAYDSQVYREIFPDTALFGLIGAILLSNGLIEVVIAIVVGAPVAWRLKLYYESRISD